ncbi:hypothetical protein G9A89_020005 [Geosiphon pyriformis]|nr:hypothetical protein G9A89_020005 [Geosiphon pyriformis]
MRKAYDLKSLVRIKMCCKFIRFFGDIHSDHTNQVMTDFGLMNSYHVHDGLNQGESSFFAAGTFVDDTIWTVVISINTHVSAPSLFISGSSISIAKSGKSHHYLGIFLSSERLSKPSLAKVHSDVRFFTNLVLRKTVSDKQFLYLVSAVLHPIIGYRTQFSFVSVSMCNKWDALICKGLKSKSGLPLDFSSDTIYHPSFYELKFFAQIQSESKVASLICFANSVGILGRLFSHRSHDLQVLCWHSIHPLSIPVCVRVSLLNNFLVGVVCIFLDCNLSLSGFFDNSFWLCGGVPMFAILGESRFIKFLSSLQQYDIAFVNQLHDQHGAVFDWYKFKQWKRLNPHGPTSEWFVLSVRFLLGMSSPCASSPALVGEGLQNIINSLGYVLVHDQLS